MFVDRIKPDSYINRYDNIRRLKFPGNNIILFFDYGNEMMKQLIHLDYFEYERIKKYAADRLNELYLPEEIEMFEKLIETLSPAGKIFMIITKKIQSYYCFAIPGGIPSFFVNGLCLKNNQRDEAYIGQLA